jgi:predicted enzyme related to lactoylglutathione lyase
MPRVSHFEIHADNLERTSKFYSDLLGWTFTRWDGPVEYWRITTGPDSEPGINGGMVKRMGPPPADMQPVSAYVCTVIVPDLDARIEKGQATGGTIALPKMPVPGVGWLAYLKDTEGNIFGMMQPDPGAKM